MNPGLPPNVADVTDYTFHAPPAVGSRVTVRPVAPLGPGEQLRAAAQAYAHGLGDLLAAEDAAVSPADALPAGGEYVTVAAKLPAEPGRAAAGSVLRTAFVRFESGDSVSVEFVARADDPRADDQFREVVRTLRPAAPADPVAGALESIAAAPGPNRAAGRVAFDLPPEFRGPASAVLASPDRRVRFEVSALEGMPAPATHPLFGDLGTATGDDGKKVRYEMAPAGPAVGGALEAMTAPAADTASGEVELNGRRVRVTATAAGDPAAAQNLVQAALDRARPKPE